MYLSREILKEISDEIKTDITFTDLEDCWYWVDKSSEPEEVFRHRIPYNYRNYILKDVLNVLKRKSKIRTAQLTCENLFCINPLHYKINY